MISPFEFRPRAATASSERASSAIIKYSGGPMRSAKAMRMGDRITIAIQPPIPPAHEPKAEIASAMPPLPCRAMGCPSQQAATEPPPPGTLIRMEAIESP